MAVYRSAPDDELARYLAQSIERGRGRLMERVLLFHGMRFTEGRPPRRRGGWFRRVKSCYRNAYLNVETDPARFVYVEGMVWGEFGPIEHAWFVDRNRPKEAIETTLSGDRGDASYCGIPFRWDYVQRRAYESGFYGALLDHLGPKRMLNGCDPVAVWLETFDAA